MTQNTPLLIPGSIAPAPMAIPFKQLDKNFMITPLFHNMRRTQKIVVELKVTMLGDYILYDRNATIKMC